MAYSLQERRTRYYAKHKQEIIAKSSVYYMENKPKVLARLKKKYEENPSPQLAQAKKWAEENSEKIKTIQKTWKERHPDKRKLYTRNSRIRAYGISPETYYEMLQKQGNECAICKAKSTRRAMAIDHDHTTGKVRGLLCDGCNMSLGHIERKEWVEKANKYLSQYK